MCGITRSHYHSREVSSCLSLVYLIYFGLLALTITLACYLEGTSPWANWTPYPSPWCELDRHTSLIREPSNAWSDFAFLFVGLFCFVCARNDIGLGPANARNFFVANPVFSVVFGIVNIMHAFGTFMGHSCRCRVGYRLDVTFMYSVTIFLASYNMVRIFLRPQRNNYKLSTSSQLTYLACYTIFVGFCWWFTGQDGPNGFYSDKARDLGMGVVVATDLISTIYYIIKHTPVLERPREKWTISVIIALFAFGLTLHTMDRMHIFCYPTSWFQGHAMWHVINALALLLILGMLRRENYVNFKATMYLEKPVKWLFLMDAGFSEL